MPLQKLTLSPASCLLPPSSRPVLVVLRGRRIELPAVPIALDDLVGRLQLLVVLVLRRRAPCRCRRRGPGRASGCRRRALRRRPRRRLPSPRRRRRRSSPGWSRCARASPRAARGGRCAPPTAVAIQVQARRRALDRLLDLAQLPARALEARGAARVAGAGRGAGRPPGRHRIGRPRDRSPGLRRLGERRARGRCRRPWASPACGGAARLLARAGAAQSCAAAASCRPAPWPGGLARRRRAALRDAGRAAFRLVFRRAVDEALGRDPRADARARGLARLFDGVRFCPFVDFRAAPAFFRCAAFLAMVVDPRVRRVSAAARPAGGRRALDRRP